MNDQVLYYETILDLNLYLRTLKSQNLDLTKNEKAYFHSCQKVLEECSVVNSLYSQQTCFAYILAQYNLNREASISLLPQCDLKWSISRAAYWEVIKYLCLYEEMKSLILSNCEEVIYQFCEEFFNYLLTTPVSKKDTEVTVHLLRLLWNSAEKDASMFSLSLMKYISRSSHILSELCQSVIEPNECLTLLVTLLFLYGQAQERLSIQNQDTPLPDFLTVTSEGQLQDLVPIYEAVMKSFNHRIFTDSLPVSINASQVRECLVTFASNHISVLEQDVLADFSNEERNVHLQCMLMGTESLSYYVMQKTADETKDHQKLKHFAKCLNRFIGRNMKAVLLNIGTHTDSVLWCLNQKYCIREIGLWYCHLSFSVKFENSSDAMAHGDRILHALMPLVSEFACFESCRRLTKKIFNLNDRFVPVQNLYQLLKQMIAHLSLDEKMEFFSWHIIGQWRANLMSVADYKSRLQVCLNRISNDEEQQHNEIVLELYLLLMIDPEVTMNRLLRTGIETKGALSSIIKCVSELSFSFGLHSLSDKPLLIAVLGELLYGDALTSFTSLSEHISHSSGQPNSEELKRRNNLLLEILSMPASSPLIGVFIESVVIPHVASSDHQLSTSLQLLQLLFSNEEDGLSDTLLSQVVLSLSSEVLTSLVATLAQLQVSMNVSQLLQRLVMLACNHLDCDFLFDLLTHEGVPLTVHLLILHLYEIQGRFIHLPAICGQLFYEEILLKQHMKVGECPVVESSNYILLCSLLEFGAVSSTSMSIAIQSLKSDALKDMTQSDVILSLIKILPQLHHEEWDRAVQLLRHLVKNCILNLPYVAQCGSMPLCDLQEYNGTLNVLQLLIIINEILEQIPASSHRQRCNQNLLFSVKCLTRTFILTGPQDAQSDVSTQNTVDFSMASSEFIRSEVSSMLDRYLLSSSVESDRYESIKLLQNELTQHSNLCSDIPDIHNADHTITESITE